MSEHRFVCPCGQPLTCNDSLLGQEIACPTCGTMLQLGEKPAPPSLHTGFTESLQHASEQRQNLQKQTDDEKMKLCQCYICKHKYYATLRSLGKKIKCPKCQALIFCQGYKKVQNDYLNEHNFQISASLASEDLYIDDQNKTIAKFFQESLKYLIIPYEAVINWDVTQEQCSSAINLYGDIEGKRKAAIVGTVLAGPVGTMVGMAGKKEVNFKANQNIRYKYHLVINLNDMNNSCLSLKNLTFDKLEKIISYLNLIKYYNEKNQNQNRKITQHRMDETPFDFYRHEKRKENAKKKDIACLLTTLLIISFVIIMIVIFRSCETKKTNKTRNYSTDSQFQKTEDSNLARRKRIAKWIRECDDREWRNPDGNIAIKKAAKHFGISESEAMNIALEGVKNGW